MLPKLSCFLNNECLKSLDTLVSSIVFNVLIGFYLDQLVYLDAITFQPSQLKYTCIIGFEITVLNHLNYLASNTMNMEMN